MSLPVSVELTLPVRRAPRGHERQVTEALKLQMFGVKNVVSIGTKQAMKTSQYLP